MEDYFEKLQEVLNEGGFKPAQIWNADETSLVPAGKEKKIITQKGAKKVTSMSNEGRVSATMMVCVSAEGEKMPPMYIFSGKNTMTGLLENAYPGSFQSFQVSGWMTQPLFKQC